jgi:GAF domain-containing protein
MSSNDPAVNRGEQIDGHQVPIEAPGADAPVHSEPGTNLDLTAVLRDVLSTAANSVSADGGFILIADEAGWPSHWFVLKDGKGQFVPPVYTRASVELSIVGWVIQRQQGDVVNDLASDSRWTHLPPSVVGAESGSALCLPLETYGQVVGVLGLVHRTAGFFKPSHQTRLQSIVDRAVPSIENARLREIVRGRTEEMAALYEVALNITADQPLDRLLDTVVAQAMDLLRCQGGGLYLWREDESVLEMVSAYDPEIDLRGTRVVAGEGLAGRVFETGDPLILDEYKDWPDQAPHIVDAGTSSRLPSAAAIAAPLVWQGQPLGVLVTTDRTPGRHFTHNDQRLLTLLANQAAAAIASVQLHDQTSRRLQELVFLNRTIQDITATLDLDEIFVVLTRRVKDLLGIEACSIALVDRETRELVFRFASGGGSETVMGERVPWGQGIVGAAAESGKPVNVSDVSQDVRHYQEIDRKQQEFVTQSILAVPMISQGQVVGVVEGLNKPGGFAGEDERLLSALASLAASVVANADLVSARRELEQLRENLTHMIIHDLRSPVGTISNSLELVE